MDSKQEEFYRELLADFRIEASEHRNTFINCLLDLEKQVESGRKDELVEVLFREIHSLKGAARAVNLLKIEQVCMAMESLMALLKQDKLHLTSMLLDILHNATNLLDSLLLEIEPGGVPVNPELVSGMIRALTTFSTSAGPVSPKYTPPVFSSVSSGDTRESESNPIPLEEKQGTSLDEVPNGNEPLQKAEEKSIVKETVRISTEKLGTLMLQAEELITAKAMFRNTSNLFNEIIGAHGNQLKVSEQAFNAMGQFTEADSQYWIEKWNLKLEDDRKLNEILGKFAKNNEQINRGISRMIDDLLIDIRKTLLIPFSSLLDLFPKLVRDLSRELKKEINLHIVGNEIEIDRRILEEIKSPLIHILRNCVDHGIEGPDLRKKRKKPASGTIGITISSTADRRIKIMIADDGEGINTEKLVISAIREKILTEEEAHNLTEKEKLKLVFLSGISTSSYITNLSGRGLGMAIVAEKVNELGGTFTVESEYTKGTTIVLSLPLSLATFRGVIVNAGDQQYIIPINSIEHVLRIKSADIHPVKNQETITFEGQVVSLVRMADALSPNNRKRQELQKATIHVLLLTSGQKRIAYVVDEIIGEQEGIVKSLGSQLVHVRNISGATVLGDGKIVLVINVAELIEYSKNINSHVAEMKEAIEDETKTGNQRILIAEDSLTSRTLLRNILEGAGFSVKTSVDGVEALSILAGEEFDLVLSDIEMPRMNGFELISRIRNDEKISSMPVILITSLESPEDRQKGMEAGANAYFIKSSFDQSNLIEIIQRLI
jgi:two-component system, chemotaxis family, sensor kinase CheA